MTNLSVDDVLLYSETVGYFEISEELLENENIKNN
jgi:hypothetical protein